MLIIYFQEERYKTLVKFWASFCFHIQRPLFLKLEEQEATQPKQDASSKQEKPAIDPEKQEKIDELKKKCDEWTEIAKGQLGTQNDLLGSGWFEEMGGKIRQMGTEAPKNMVENYNFEKHNNELNHKKIEQFERIKKFLERGALQYPWGGSLEKDLDDWINKSAW